MGRVGQVGRGGRVALPIHPEIQLSRLSTHPISSDKIPLMRCTECKSYIPEGALHCPECGRPARLEKVCRKCGATTDSRARYCRKCGAAFEHPAGPAAIEEQPDSKVPKQKRKCALCGSNVPDDVQYCPSCGTNQDVPDGKIDLHIKPKADTDSSATDAVEEAVCPACGTEIRGSGRFCYACGRFMDSDVEDVICPKCGAHNSLRYSRCQYCGASIPSPPKLPNKKK